MSKTTEFIYCKLQDTPKFFDIDKLKANDPDQKELYKKAKKPNMDTILAYEEVIDEDKKYNYARFVPKGYMFIDIDDPKEAEEMRGIILRSKLKCLILETTNGYHFLFKIPKFYKVQMTGATNWFGYKFDTKGVIDKEKAVQIIRVCGMERKEYCSWDFTEAVTLDKLEKLDILPYWLFGKKEDKDLHKEGKTGESEYTLTDTPFTQLMKMKDGGRHDHIFNKCRYFACSNGFEYKEFKSLITAIHDQYLCKIGTPMSDSDLFGDTETKWEEDIENLENNGWVFEKKERKWKKAKSKKEDKIDERRAAEYLFKQYDFYVTDKNTDGTYNKLLHRDKDGNYEYRNNVPERKQKLREFNDQNFQEPFFKEMERQLMQLCIENNKIISRNDEYIIVKNKVLSCITPDAYDFSWIGSRAPTDVVLPWNWYSEDWVKEHEEDLGGQITWFIEQLSRNSKGIPQPIVQNWLWVIAGASMVPANMLQKIVILSGGGQNGKSLYTSLIRLCLGADMFNESKIFDSNPHDGFWGEGLDKGICCVIDDLNRVYNRDAFSYIKGAITGTDSVVINEKFKAKKRLDILPQIIACTNFEFELYDKSEGMKRRVKILPTECYIENKDKDENLQYKLVLNVSTNEEVAKYRMSKSSYGGKGVKKIMHMYTKESGVLESLKNGSLAWFANKARYMYMKWLMKELVLEDSEEMKVLHDHSFKNKFEIKCEDFINWYLDSKCGTEKDRNLSKANIYLNNLYPEYETYCEVKGIIDKMTDWQLKRYCSPAIISLGYKIENKKMKKENGRYEPYRYVVFGEKVAPSKNK